MLVALVELQLAFAAAHRVDSPRAGCPGLHGHNFRLRVSLEGEVDPTSGTVADLPRVEALLQELVYRPLDHGLLNDHLANPTLERLALHIAAALAPSLPELVEVRLEDGSGRSATVGRGAR
jgi:6-pyruvoyltetrahydropterin/6-carboxytetrahydropterin synthase